MLIETKYSRLMTKIRSYRGADGKSDPIMVRIRLKHCTPANKNSQNGFRIFEDMKNLKEKETRRSFEEKISNNVEIKR